MKILITGGAGFIGGHLAEKLTTMGHEVIGIDNFFHPTKNPNNSKVQKFDITGGEIFHLPSQGGKTLSELIREVDIVYHLAAQIHVDYSLKYPQETFDVNLIGTLKILEACKKYDKKLVFASTSEVYGSSQDVFMNATHPLNPQSPYAVSKLAADKLCQVYKDMYGMKINIIRNFNTFGEWQNDTSYGGVIAIFTRNALEGKPLQIYGDGFQSRDYMYITDALKPYIMSLTQDFDGPVNFGTGKTITINELAKTIIKITDSQSPIVHIKPRPGEVKRLCADIRLAEDLGFKSTTNLEEDLIKYTKWYKEQM